MDIQPLHPEFYDLAFKEIFAEPDLLAQFLAAALDPQIFQRLEFAHAQPIASDLSDPLTGKAVADTVWLIPWRERPDLPPFHIILLLEHQSRPHPQMPLRIFLYIARYLRKHANAWRLRELQRRKKQKTQGIKRAKPDDVERLKLPVIIPVVFYTGSAPWTAPRSLIALYDYSELLEPFIPDWVTIYWDLRDQDRQALLDSPAELLQALAVIQRDPSKKPDEQEFETFKNQMLAALKGVVSRQSHLKVQAQEKLLELMFGSLVRNCTNDERKILLSATKTYLQSEDAEKTMTTHLSSDNVYDRFAKAVSDSRKKDVRRGELRMARQILQELLEQRFGQPLKPEILERVQQCKSAVQLRNATLAVSTLTSLEDLRLEKSSPSTA